MNRIRLIVTELQQYARPGEFAGYIDEFDASIVLTDTLPLVQHEACKPGADVVSGLQAKAP